MENKNQMGEQGRKRKRKMSKEKKAKRIRQWRANKEKTTLQKIATEKGWDCKTNSAYSLTKSITDPTFIVALNVCSYTLGFTKPLSVMLQATSADIIKAYNNINLVQTQLQVLRKDCDQVFDESIWKNATHMATIAETELIAQRICQRMIKRSNIPAGSSKDYFKVAVLIPTIDHLL